MEPRTIQRIAESLQQLGPGGTVEREVLLETLRSIESAWTDADLTKILQAAGLPENEPISCSAFTSWLFDLTDLPGTTSAPHPAVSRKTSTERYPRLHEIPEVHRIGNEMTVEFLTDVEGNWEYFVHFVSWSQVLGWSGLDRGLWGPGELQLAEHGYLVFGGDAVDKGSGDIRVVKTLLELKRRYWDRVFIVLGNRDICKLRFYAELQPGEDGGSFERRGGAYWIPDPKPSPDYETYLQMHHLERGHVSTVRWVLDCNMGCQQTTFNTRRHELALLGLPATDEAVVDSYRDSVDPSHPDCWMLDFLRVGQLAVILGDALFIHGGLYDDCLGRVPEETASTANMREWAARLNAWKDAQLEDFERRPTWDEYNSRGGEKLIDYGCPGGGQNATIVYHNPFNNGNPQQLSPRVEDFLQKSGIRRVFSGHQPHGESPTVVRHTRSGLLVVTADTSYSNMSALKLFNQSNNRGEVVTNVRLRGGRVQLEGILRDGSKHRCELHVDPAEAPIPDALVGCQLNDGSWVKTVLEDGRVLAALGKRFQVSVQSMHPGKACLMLKSVYFSEKLRVSLKNLSAEWLLESQKHVQLLPGPEPSGTEAHDHWYQATQFKREEFDSAETYIFDGHGTLWGVRNSLGQGVSNLDLEEQVIQKVNSLIAAGKQVIFATNDSNYSRRLYIDRLLKHGIRLCHDDEFSRSKAKQKVVTAAFTCAWFLKKALIRKPFVICSHPGLLEELREAGITDYVATIDHDGRAKEEYFAPVTKENVTKLVQQSKDVDAIVVGWDQQLTALKVAVAAAFLKWSRAGQNAMQIVQCSSDHAGVLGVTSEDFLPGRNFANQSIPAVGNGTMCQMVCASVGEDIQAIDVGKPSEVLIEALRRPVEEEGYGVELDKAVMVGDTLNTDIELAVRSGMRSLLVLSGVTSRSDLEKLRETTRFPTWVLESLAHI